MRGELAELDMQHNNLAQARALIDAYPSNFVETRICYCLAYAWRAPRRIRSVRSVTRASCR